MYGCHGRAFLAGNEVQLDLIAKELGIDPMEIRIKNGLTSGEKTATKSWITSGNLAEPIQKAALKAGWEEKRGRLPKNKGIGMGCVAIMTGFPMGFRSGSSCYVKLNDDGQATIVTGVVDNGQGNESMMVQIASEVLGIPMDDINLINADTEITNLDPGAYSQAAAFVGGNAVKKACEDARRQILALASEKLSEPLEDLDLQSRMVICLTNAEKKMPISWITREAFLRAKPITGVGSYIPIIDFEREWVSKPFGQMAGTYSFGASVAEVSVDDETGKITISRFITAHDCGKALNPVAVEGQMEGSVQQAGVASIIEGNLWRDGFLLNPDLLEYKVPLACDMPEIDTIIVESNDPEGPFGAKEGGLTVRMNAYSAVACAVSDAIGVQFRELPLTPDKVLAMIDKKKGGVR
jgi:CO/xanthine dehydrogenase Mo-binding subunit